jgi:CheY-like chemotaxis protein
LRRMRTVASDPGEPAPLRLVGLTTPTTTGAERDRERQQHSARRVLIVEDESPIRRMLAELLAHAGYGVLQAGDGFEALQVLRDDHPDLIVLDLMLPRMTAWQFLERSRRDLDSDQIPVLIDSAIAGEREDPMSLGVAAWLTKPVDLDRFLTAVENLAGPADSAPRSLSTALLETGSRLLVVEDEPAIRHVLLEYLREEGYLVDAAGSIADARQRIAAAPPDLLLLDLMLPGQSGWDFLRERRKDPALANLRVVALSAAPKDLLLQAKELGADAFLSKPFDLDVLRAIVETFVS